MNQVGKRAVSKGMKGSIESEDVELNESASVEPHKNDDKVVSVNDDKVASVDKDKKNRKRRKHQLNVSVASI